MQTHRAEKRGCPVIAERVRLLALGKETCVRPGADQVVPRGSPRGMRRNGLQWSAKSRGSIYQVQSRGLAVANRQARLRVSAYDYFYASTLAIRYLSSVKSFDFRPCIRHDRENNRQRSLLRPSISRRTFSPPQGDNAFPVQRARPEPKVPMSQTGLFLTRAMGDPLPVAVAGQGWYWFVVRARARTSFWQLIRDSLSF